MPRVTNKQFDNHHKKRKLTALNRWKKNKDLLRQSVENEQEIEAQTNGNDTPEQFEQQEIEMMDESTNNEVVYETNFSDADMAPVPLIPETTDLVSANAVPSTSKDSPCFTVPNPIKHANFCVSMSFGIVAQREHTKSGCDGILVPQQLSDKGSSTDAFLMCDSCNHRIAYDIKTGIKRDFDKVCVAAVTTNGLNYSMARDVLAAMNVNFMGPKKFRTLETMLGSEWNFR